MITMIDRSHQLPLLFGPFSILRRLGFLEELFKPPRHCVLNQVGLPTAEVCNDLGVGHTLVQMGVEREALLFVCLQT